MPSPPRSLEEAVNRIARALADDDGSGWWGEEDGVPVHAPVAQRLAEAGGVSALLERLQEVERENERLRELAEHVATLWAGTRLGTRAASALAQGAAAPLPGDRHE